MKALNKVASVIVFAVMLFGAFSTVVNTQPVIDDSEKPAYLFTMSATSGSFENDRLTLNGISLVVYFSDRPYRVSGHMSLKDFRVAWEEGPETYNRVPPNAELAIYDQDGDTQAVLIIDQPEIGEGTISFRVVILDEDITETFGHATLFIDGICLNGLSPKLQQAPLACD